MITLPKGFCVSFLVAGCLLASQGQTKPAAPTSRARTSTLLVDTDDTCRLVLDGNDQGVITPAQSKKIDVTFGDHVLKCTVESVPDLVWRKVVEVKTSEQVAAIVALKALHIQYDQAVAERNQAAAAEEKRKADLVAAEQKQQADLAAAEQKRINDAKE